MYDGVHNGPVLGSGISGLVRLVTHKATGLKYAVKVLDLGLVDTDEGLKQLREEIYIMCQLGTLSLSSSSAGHGGTCGGRPSSSGCRPLTHPVPIFLSFVRSKISL